MSEPPVPPSIANVTEHLTLNTVIHAAVRRDVARFQQAMADFPVGSRERAAQLEMAWQNLDHQLYHHHHGEETIFWPALRELGADESLVGDLGGEHERLAEAMKLTRNAMSALASDPAEANVDQARAAFDTLGDVVDTHFTHEERDLEPMLAGVIASPEWNRAQAQIRKTQGPAATGVMVAWLLDNADPDARTFVRHEIPRPAVFVLSHVLGRSYKKVAARCGSD
jgi:Hemerythrin HHE cation binding domain